MKKVTKSMFILASVCALNAGSILAQPSVSAPTPTVDAAKVVSVFSDAYTNGAGGTNFNPGWGQATVQSMIQIGNDNILKYANLNYQGTEFGTHVNAADMKYMHVDVYTGDETTFQITPISPGKELLYTVPTLNQNSWNSYDIPLTVFAAANINWADLFQIKVVGSGGKTVYVDNIYFYTDATADTQAPTAFTATLGTIKSDEVQLVLNATDNSGAVFFDITYGSTTLHASAASGVSTTYAVTGLTGSTGYSFSVVAKDRSGNTVSSGAIVVNATTLAALPAAPTPTVDAAKVISIFSDAYTNVSGTNFYPTWSQTTVASQVSLGGNATMKYSNYNYQGIELGSHIDVSAMTKLHVDIYPTTETSVRLTPISPGKELPTSLGTLTANQWNSFDVLLSTYTGVVKTDIFQFKFDGGTSGEFYMDNLYFFNDAAAGLNDVVDNHGVYCYVSNSDQLLVNSKSELKSVTLRGLTGQLIKSINVSGLNHNLDISGMAAGNYLVTVQLANGLVTTQKIIKF